MTTSALNEQTPDADLWRSVCQGSVPAFEAVVRRYQSRVCAVAYSACGDLAFSEDVAQEAFWSAWRERASLAEPGRLGAWLCGIARNLGHNTRRRASRSAQTAPLEAAANVPAGGPGPVETAVSREEEALVWQTLEQIPESYREPLILFYRENQSVAEVAAALDLTPDAVKQRLSRGRCMLQERMGQLIEGVLQHSRPGRAFTVAVMTGVATLSVGAKTALAGTGAAKAVGPLAKAAGAGVAGGLVGAVLGSLGGLLGAWFGIWLPAQLAPTRSESQHLRRCGKRIFLVTVLFTAVLAIPLFAGATGQLSTAAYLMSLGAWFVGLWSYLAGELVCIARALKRIRSDPAQAEPNDAPLRVGLEAVAARYRGRVFRSRTSFLGIPLLDIQVSDPARAGVPSQRSVARGWIAIGNDAYGVLFAFGGRAYGMIAFGGQLAVGLIAVGGAAVGAFALGGLAAGVVALGGLSLGWQAGGGGAVAWDVAAGGSAAARHTAYGGMAVAHDDAVGGAAWARQVNNPAAKSAVFRQPLIVAFKWVAANGVCCFMAILCAVLLGYALGLSLMYRRAVNFKVSADKGERSMALSRGAKFGMAFGLFGSLVGIGAGAVVLVCSFRPASPREPLTVRLDPSGPYVILATMRAARDYPAAIAKARALHPKAERHDFDPTDFRAIQETLRKRQPRYALVFIEPDELDVNFAWRWLAMTSQLDDDPFVDVRTGFVTGATPKAVAAFIERIAAAVDGRRQLPGVFVDNLGPPEQGTLPYFNTFSRSDFAPVLATRFNLRTLVHGKGCFTDDRLDSMDGAGLVHFGGHGHPNQIDDGLRAAQVPKLKLAPCVVFNGACYTGVTHRWYDETTGRAAEQTVAAQDCFCLNLLGNEAIAYLAALHPDHGMPVYQEMECLACEGLSLGEVIKRTHDGVVLAAGGKMPAFAKLQAGAVLPNQSPADVMLEGAAARVLFGDPALIVCDAFTPPPFAVEVAEEADVLRVTATLRNAALASTFTDTYHNDLNPQAPFNDRALVSVDLPAGWKEVGKVEIVGVRARGATIAHRLVGRAVEYDAGRCRLHVQVDVPAQAFQKSALRVVGAAVEIVVRRP